MWNAVPIQVSIDSMKSFNNRAHSIGTANLLIFYIILSNKKLNISVICFSHDFTEVNYFKYLVSLCVGEKITRDTESRKIFFLKVCLLVLVNKGYTKCMQYISCKIKRLMFWKLTVLLKTQLILLLYYGKKKQNSIPCMLQNTQFIRHFFGSCIIKHTTEIDSPRFYSMRCATSALIDG